MSTLPPAALLDDDSLVRSLWKLAARRAGVSLILFAREAELRAALPSLPRETVLYIDVTLGPGEDGLAVAREARSQGFPVYLATGLPPDALPKEAAALSGIVGKDPPW